MKTLRLILIYLTMLIIVVACSDEKVKEEIILSEGIPDFVRKSDFEKINWENKAVEFGNRGIIGNENKSGVIGADAPSLASQKWMWHLWGVPVGVEMTVVGFHRKTKEVHQILNWPEWTIQMGGPNNGADAQAPSCVKIPETGEWAILLYIDGNLFDTLIFKINE